MVGCVSLSGIIKEFGKHGDEGDGGSGPPDAPEELFVDDLASAIRARFPDMGVETRVVIKDPTNGIIRTEFDIETENYVIQVKGSDKAQGLGPQIDRSRLYTNKTVIGYAPNLPDRSIAALTKQGYTVDRTEADLLRAISP